MRFDLNISLQYQLFQPTDLLLQIEAAHLPDQQVQHANINVINPILFERVPGNDGIGERIWVRCDGVFDCYYRARVDVDRQAEDISQLASIAPHKLPADTLRYLMPSRFCPADRFQPLVAADFGNIQGGALVAKMRDWIFRNIQYVSGSSGPQTTALDTYMQRQGVCRDFAHLLICLVRAAAIPARFASVYAPGVTPQDFHAVAEVYLEGGWHLVDATGMATADTIARIGVGLDAADTSFLSGFGAMGLMQQTVDVTIVDG